MKKNTTIVLVAMILLCALVQGCWKTQGIFSQDGGSDGDTDTDTDVDTDTDADTDTEIPLPDCLFYVDAQAQNTNPDGSSWSNAFPEIQLAVDVADQLLNLDSNISHCELWVRQGTYQIYNSSPTDTLNLRSYVHIYGGFAGNETSLSQRDWENNTTTLDGADQTGGNDRVHHVVTAASVEDTILDGFTITRGGSTTPLQYMYGGGLTADNSTLFIANCTFVENTASGSSQAGGGGAFLAQCEADVVNCTFTANEAYDGAGLMIIDGEVRVSDSTFHGNVAEWKGAGIYSIGSVGSPEPLEGFTMISDCMFTENQGSSGTAVHSGNRRAVIWNSFFLSNTASYVGGAIYQSQPSGLEGPDMEITNSIFWDNTSPEGGALALAYNSSISVLNSTLRKNTGTNGAIYVNSGSNLEVVNSILWNPPGTEITADVWDTSVIYSDIRGGYPGTGNIQQNPEFSGTESDVTLAPGSPCVDAADGTLAPAMDIKDDPRVDVAGAPNVGIGPPWADMGAYEQSN